MPRALGFVHDISVGINTVADLAAGANTGKRFHMRNYETLGILFYKNAASAGTDDIILTLKEANANTGGTLQALSAITDVYQKSVASPLLGTEVWVENTQAKASTYTISGASFAAHQGFWYFDVDAASMSDGFQWLSLDIADPGAGGTIVGGVWYIATELKQQRKPDLLVQVNA